MPRNKLPQPLDWKVNPEGTYWTAKTDAGIELTICEIEGSYHLDVTYPATRDYVYRSLQKAQTMAEDRAVYYGKYRKKKLK